MLILTVIVVFVVVSLVVFAIGSLLDRRSSRARLLRDRLASVQKAADWIAEFSGSISFLMMHIVVFFVWIVLNVGALARTRIGGWDTYPFGLLTMSVSLEAIVLSVFVLLSQNRQYQVFSTRQSKGSGLTGMLNRFVGDNATIIFPVIPALAATIVFVATQARLQRAGFDTRRGPRELRRRALGLCARSSRDFLDYVQHGTRAA